MLKEIFLAAPDGRVLFYDLLPQGAGGTPVSATAARIASHAYAMPPATQPAVTQASQTPFGCRMLAGQVHCDEDHRGVGLLAGRVASDYTNSLSVWDQPLVEYLAAQKSTHEYEYDYEYATQIHAYPADRAFNLWRMACLVRACEGPRAIGWGRTDFRACTGLPAWVINLCTM